MRTQQVRSAFPWYSLMVLAADVLWAGGIPVVTMPSDTMQTRLASGVSWGYGPSAQLTTARNVEDYAWIINRIVASASVRRRLKEALSKEGPEGSPLFSTADWISDLEQALSQMAEAVIALDKKFHVISSPGPR